MTNILIVNGPNLNMLGRRETTIYGTHSLKDIEAICVRAARSLSIKNTFRQSNSEGELIGWIQEAGAKFDGLIINAAGLSHTSVAIMDALLTLSIPVIEVHLTNIFKREEFRHHSYVSKAARGVICGFGADSYVLALNAMANLTSGAKKK